MTQAPEEKSVEWFRSLLAAEEGPLLRYAARIVGDLEQARDVVQETFLRLLASGKGPDSDHVRQWLFTVCRNRALDVCRKERRMNFLAEHDERSRPGREPPPLAEASRRERAALVVEALRSLPARQQEIVRLRFQEGFSYRQIAGITGLSVSNVGFLIHTAIGKLRKHFRAAGLLRQM